MKAVLVLCICIAIVNANVEFTSLVRYWNPTTRQHFTDVKAPPNGFGNDNGNYIILKTEQPNTTLQFSCQVPGMQSNYFKNDVAYCKGHTVLGPIGYFYNQPTGDFKTPLYYCHDQKEVINDFFLWEDKGCEGRQNVGMIGYVLKPKLA